MKSHMKFKKTHLCNELGIDNIGQEAVLMGWVSKRRDLGGLIFVDLRDREGTTQIVFDSKKAENAFSLASNIRPEYVIAAKGTVERRPSGTENSKINTGVIELVALEMEVLNPAKTPPFSIVNSKPQEEQLRLRYRYMDLRTKRMQDNLRLRHKTLKTVRDFMDNEGFWEIETPMLISSTPEGARDYLVPSRVYPGSFFALPQSPQLFKQLLMVSGIMKYFQVARCLRDEDLRADRQPEHTQIDIEMSFVDSDDILDLVERLMQKIYKNILNIDLKTPFPRITYNTSIKSYGTDKPDLRYKMDIIDFTDIFTDTQYKRINDILLENGRVCGIVVKQKANFSRKEIDIYDTFIKQSGGKGLFAILFPNLSPKSALTKYLSPEKIKEIIETANIEEGDALLLAADIEPKIYESLGSLRQKLAKDLSLIDKNKNEFLWVIDFPLFEWDENEKILKAMHHPFTSPYPEDIELLEKDPIKVRANLYDLVLNGSELGSGSIRIHNREIQEKVFKAIGVDIESAKKKFGFLLEAFEYGAPPHGGIALGVDRICMYMAGENSIREVIAFPKTNTSQCLLTGAPKIVDNEQLELLRIKLDPASSAG